MSEQAAEFLVGMVPRVRRSEKCGALFAALAKAQGSFGVVAKDRQAKVKTKAGGEYSYDYATLASVQNATRPALSEHGLCLTQFPTAEDGNAIVVSILGHAESGEWIETELSAQIPSADRMSPLQTMGSVFSFLKRYAWTAICGVSSEDDDDDGGAEDVKPRPLAKTRPAADDTDVPFDPPSRSQRPDNSAGPWAEVIKGHLAAIGTAGKVADVLGTLDAAKNIDAEAWKAGADALRKVAARKVIEIAADLPELAHASRIGKETTAEQEWHDETKRLYSARRKAIEGAAQATAAAVIK